MTSQPPQSPEESQTPQQIVDRFAAYLAQIGEHAAIEDWQVLAGGRSARTLGLGIRLAGGGRVEAVLSLTAPTGPLQGLASPLRQYELLKLLHGSDVPVARPLWASDDDAFLGHPFLVTERVDGTIADLWRPDGIAFVRRARANASFRDSLVRALANIHAVTVDSLPISARRPAEPNPARRETERWAAVIRASRAFRDDPVLTYAVEWLRVHAPEPTETTLFHGDYRVGNLVLDEHSVRAVLDWELAEEGDPLLDLAVLLSPPLRNDGLADGIWHEEELIERYEAFSGRAATPAQLTAYRALATLKVAGVWVNASLPFDEGATDVHALRAGYSVLDLRRLLADALALPPSTSTATAAVPRQARAAETLRRALRENVLPAVTDPGSREEGAVIVATLRSLATRERGGRANAAFAAAAARFLDEYRRSVPSFSADEERPLAHQASASIRHAFAHDLAEDLAGPLGHVVRAAAEAPLDLWP